METKRSGRKQKLEAKRSPYVLMEEEKNDGAGQSADSVDGKATSFDSSSSSSQGTYQVPKDSDNFLLSCIGSFSTAYNIISISLAMLSLGCLYTLAEEQESLIASTMFAGMVAGQIAGALTSALVFPPHVYLSLAVARFFLGIGAGGVYPLAAAMASEASGQGVAFVSMNALATLLAYVTEDHQVIARLLLGVGALPGLCILVLQGCLRAERPGGVSGGHGTQEAWQQLRLAFRDGRTRKRLSGCSLTWFLYDVAFFGNTLFQPVIGDAVLGGDNSIRSKSSESLLLAFIALPGYFIAVLTMTRLGPRYIQVQGFILCALLYLILALAGQRLIDAGVGGIALILYGLTFLFWNFGPGSTTYLFPCKVFHPQVRATLNGIASAAGKIGGFLGSYCFPGLLKAYGLPSVLAICCIIALLGAGITLLTLWERPPGTSGSGDYARESVDSRGKRSESFDARAARMLLNPVSDADSPGAKDVEEKVDR